MNSAEQFGIQVGSEVAKAVGEAAKEAMTDLIGPSSREVGALFGDKIAEWRLKNLIKAYERVKTRYPDSRLPKEAIERLPFGFRALFIEEASREENAEIQKMWAQLLITSLQGGYRDEYKAFAQDLRYLNPSLVLIIEAIRVQPQGYARQKLFEATDCPLSNEHAAVLAGYADEHIQANLASMLKLGIGSCLPNFIDNGDLGPLSSGYYETESAELAASVALAMQQSIPLQPPDPEKRYSKCVWRDELQGIWFDHELTAYGARFTSACMVTE